MAEIRRAISQRVRHADHHQSAAAPADDRAGNQISVAREIDHLAIFPSEKQARDAGVQLAEHGFRLDELEPPDDERWRLGFHRDDACDEGRPDEFVFEILDVILPFDGDYDGWGSMLVKG